MAETILEVRDLAFSFDTYAGEVQAVRGVSFHVEAGETLAIVGESGCGKSVTVQSIMRLVPTPPGRLKAGSVRYLGEEITALADREMARLRGRHMSMIFQDPMTCLNPTMRVGNQIAEGICRHQHIAHSAALARAQQMLGKVGIPSPARNASRYPHQFSGGMRQRVMIAMALCESPKLLFADEPTTALDVTTQAQILRLMEDLKGEFGASVVLITHDLGVVARVSQRVAVMYAGKIVETGSARDIFYAARHPYTQGLLRSTPHRGGAKEKQLLTIPGAPPDLFAPPAGCGFMPRCPHAMRVCRTHQPAQTEAEPGHYVSCWLQDARAPQGEVPRDAF
ncbi:oligopeptide transport ATP-binding protein OppD [Clostridia bacterium]|nr:oligopeptide transport ATP-binding protein OppD [Clostridia bacterium]